MGFIKVCPLRETVATTDADFGRANPARCVARRRFQPPGGCLAATHIAAFEAYPLYLVCEAEPNGVVNGIRVLPASGPHRVLADDPEEGEPGFLELLGRAAGGMVEMPACRYLRELEGKGRI
jgi:hypothetical protein